MHPVKLLSQFLLALSAGLFPACCTGAHAAKGHVVENSIPLSIFPISPNKFVFCFCGLPGRGKTHISRRLGRYLEFFHAVPVRVFNVAEYRQRLCGGLKDAEWFDLNNQEALALRTQCNQAAIRDMELFLSECDNGVAILDSTNPTHQRRVNLKTAVRAYASSLWNTLRISWQWSDNFSSVS